MVRQGFEEHDVVKTLEGMFLEGLLEAVDCGSATDGSRLIIVRVTSLGENRYDEIRSRHE